MAFQVTMHYDELQYMLFLLRIWPIEIAYVVK